MTISQECSYEYWFAAPDVINSHGDRPIYLNMTNQESAQAQVDITLFNRNLLPTISVTIPGGGSNRYDLTTFIADIENINPSTPSPPFTVQNKGIRISSNMKLSVNYEVLGKRLTTSTNPINPEMFTIKGSAALGKDFYIPSQDDYKNNRGYEQVIVVATEDNTNITFTAPNTSYNTKYSSGPNLPSTLVLNRGETFQLTYTEQTIDKSFWGLRISSDKNIAVTISDDSIYGGGPYDLIGDQIIPIENLGTKHIVVNPNFPDSSEDKVYIMGTVNSTSVSLTSSISGFSPNSLSVNEGEQTMIDIGQWPDLFIDSSEPVYVYHLSGTWISSGRQEFGSALIPPIQCTGINNISGIRTGVNVTNSFKLVFLKKSSSLINQTGFSPQLNLVSGWTSIGASGFEYKVLEANNSIALGDSFTFSSTDKFHLGIVNQLAGSSSYGFLSNFTTLNICSTFELCENNNETALLDAGQGYDDYQWFYNGASIAGASNSTFTAGNPGIYLVEVSCEGITLTSNEINVIAKSPEECPISYDCCESDLIIQKEDGELVLEQSTINDRPISLVLETFEINQYATIPITEVRATITDIQFNYNYDNCAICVDNPALWGSLSTNLSTIGNPPNNLNLERQMYSNGGLPNMISNNEDIRELLWINPNGAMLTVGDSFTVQYLLPPASEIPCCVTTARICIKISWKDANCNLCEDYVCSDISIEVQN